MEGTVEAWLGSHGTERRGRARFGEPRHGEDRRTVGRLVYRQSIYLIIKERRSKMTKDLVLDELKKIEEEKGIIMPQDVVERARDINSPLHPKFEWGESRAAELYRCYQARNMIVKFTVIIAEQKTQAFYNVRVENEPQGYVSTEIILKQRSLYENVLHQAAKELTTWQNKYSYLRELGGLVSINEEKLGELLKEG